MTRELTRRQAITGTASALAIGGSASLAGAETGRPADAVVDVEHDAEYPRCVYDRTDDGEWEASMPINIHARVPGSEAALSVVEDAFTGPDDIRWTRAFPDSTAKAWDRDEEALVAPDHSFRRPRLGDGWAHTHIWGVDENRVAIHAHLDVLDLTASHFHRGTRYGDAARKATDQLLADGWNRQVPYSIDYGVDDAQRDEWGQTGDAKVEWLTS